MDCVHAKQKRACSRVVSFPSSNKSVIFPLMPTDADQPGEIPDRGRFERALQRFDDENSRDPNIEVVDGLARPRELVYAERLFRWVMTLRPEASEPLRLAARSQHICRWLIPRADYPMDRAGYLRWRADLRQFHARRAGEILRDTGYSEEVITRVQALNLKKEFPADPESRVLEDALCLVFLQYQLGELAARTAEDKILNALRKSWKKMTPAGQAHARALPLSPSEKTLVQRALGAGTI
jgi:hypothetical protein